MKRLALLLACGLLAACTTLEAPLSDEPVADDPGQRTLGARIEDNSIERKVMLNASRSLPALAGGRLVVASWNGQVLLAGQVPDAQLRDQVEQVARQVRHVVHVHNELVVGEPITRAARTLDATITGRVKTALAFAPDVPSRRVKVITENGVVYLMGIVSRAEAALVVDVARNVAGVQKIVKIFEYLPETP